MLHKPEQPMTTEDLLKLSPSEKRVKIAETAGWTCIESRNTMAIQGAWVGYPPSNAIIGQKQEIPRFLDDLNAMHEAEKIIAKDKWEHYAVALERVCSRDDDPEGWEVYWEGSQKEDRYIPESGGDYYEVQYNSLRYFLSATAEQRAEAFLRAVLP
jgi:hypothetical protein